jgi:aspartyl-tRNA(Asn)/glutamyl-tRNA(Gln) amidotransferase subunit C
MNIDDSLISHLEELSKLSLSEKEKEVLKKDLKEIIKMFEILKNAKFDSSLENMTNSVSIMREDLVKTHTSVSDALKNAPDSHGHYFKVPKIIDL